jgi:eukaryotic-like serine/threonine-protein kinase
MQSGPAMIGRYRVDSVLGRGAMGVIYRAHDPEIDRPVAIKLIRADLLAGADRDSYILRFRREAQAAGRCIHPNIVAVYDFGLHEGNPFFVMELVDGSSLSETGERGIRFGPDQAVSIILQVLAALAAAHKVGVIHRDIKPANILLVGGSLVKVTDFGISRVNRSDLTDVGMMIGTPSYMSPEQCRGLPIDPRSDLFSAGVVLYELLCGERPFAAPDAAAVVHRLLNEAPPDIITINAAVSPALKSIVDRALAKSPGERFASASDMASALRALPASASTSADTVLSDRTLISPQTRATGPRLSQEETRSAASAMAGGGAEFDIAALAAVERMLATHIGPIARVVLRAAIEAGGTAESLCDALALKIARPEERHRFRAEALPVLQRAARRGATTFAAEELERVQKELARHIGPIARVLVTRSATEARSVTELWELLSRHIEREDERRDFLNRRGAS